MNLSTLILSIVFALLSLTSTSQVVINELDVANQLVEIKNLGASPLDITGYRLCNFPNYPVLGPSNTISGSLNIPAGGLVVVNGSELGLNLGDDELGLYLPTGSFGTPSAIVDYIEWGLTPHTRSGTAVSAGTWTAGEFIPAPPSGQTINYDGSGDSASDYYFSTSTIGEENNPAPGCTAAAFASTPSGVENDQTTAGGTRTTLKWDHYSDDSDGCLLQGALTDGETNTSPFVQVLVEGSLISGDVNGQDKSPNLGASSPYLIFNPNTYPSGNTGNLIPGADYMWQVRCGCIINNSLPLPMRLFPSNLHLSPWSEFDFFTNLGGSLTQEASSNKLLDNSGLKVYPNPTQGQVQIEMNSLSFEARDITVINAIGEVVLKVDERIKGAVVNLDLTRFDSGIYTLRVNGETDSVTKLLMVQ